MRTVNSEIFAIIFISRIALKHIFAALKFTTGSWFAPYCARGYYCFETSLPNIRPSRKLLNLQYIFIVWYDLFWIDHYTHLRSFSLSRLNESKGAKIRNRYNQVPHLTQDTNGKVTNSQLDTTNESQEGSPFPAGEYKAHINRRAQWHSKHKTEKHKRSTKEVPPWNGH